MPLRLRSSLGTATPFGRRAIVLAGLLTVVASACGPGDAPSRTAPDPPFVDGGAGEERRGVILVLIDTLRADHLGLYGSRAGLTPNLDALGESSYVFDRAVAPSSWTRPSVASLLTSRYPTAVGVLDKDDLLRESELLLPEVLRQYGGFRTFAVSTNGNTSEAYGFGQGYDHFVSPHLLRSYPGGFPIYVGEGVTAKAIELLDQLGPSDSFFLFVHYLDPHDPYLPHPGLLDQPEPPGRFDGSRPSLEEMARQRGRATETDRERIRHLYAGEVKYCDLWVGALLDALSARGLDEDTLLIVTSDHGEGLWDHRRRDHGNDLYEETVWVPLIIRLPGMRSGDGRRISQPVSLVDVAPTVLATVGLEAPVTFQGADLGPLLDGLTRPPAYDFIYTEMNHRGRSFESIRRGEMKLIRDRRPRAERPATWEIFDLASDARERADLREKRPREAAPLQDALRRWSRALTLSAPGRRQVGLAQLDRQTLDSLRALGYVGADATGAANRKTRDVEAARPAGSPAEDRAAESYLSRIDFPPQAPSRVDGRQPVPAGVHPTSTVVLRRKLDHERWFLRGSVASPYGRGPWKVIVLVDGDARLSASISTPGEYLLDGPLPPFTAAGLVRLDVGCEPTTPPEVASEPTAPCLALSSIGLL
ncbi:MAG: sulfatase [Thermoanaerobaculia bacterium]|nr:sulfatase [Thermoanaerobaculia bacterium]